jgi:hypothetical protein
VTMRLITARRYPRKVTFAVHLDTTKMTVDDPLNPLGAAFVPAPDPAWVLTETYELGKGERRQQGETDAAYRTRVAAYLTNIRTDMRARCDVRLAELVDATDPGVALPGEGQTF